MKNIVIFASVTGKAAERVVSLFNEGNRIHTSLVVTDIQDNEFSQRLSQHGCTVIVVDTDLTEDKRNEIATLVAAENPALIVADQWNGPLPEELAQNMGSEFVAVSSAENAPREVVAAVEKPLETENEKPREPGIPKTPDEEWAEALQMNFDPERLRQMPPPLPGEEANPPQVPENETIVEQPAPQTIYEASFSPQDHRHREKEKFEPMPPTYLIWSVLVTIFCCFIPGIIAIIFSSQVSSKYYIGDVEGARRASRNAEGWIIASFILGVLTATLYLPIMLLS